MLNRSTTRLPRALAHRATLPLGMSHQPRHRPRQRLGIARARQPACLAIHDHFARPCTSVATAGKPQAPASSNTIGSPS